MVFLVTNNWAWQRYYGTGVGIGNALVLTTVAVKFAMASTLTIPAPVVLCPEAPAFERVLFWFCVAFCTYFASHQYLANYFHNFSAESMGGSCWLGVLEFQRQSFKIRVASHPLPWYNL